MLLSFEVVLFTGKTLLDYSQLFWSYSYSPGTFYLYVCWHSSITRSFKSDRLYSPSRCSTIVLIQGVIWLFICFVLLKKRHNVVMRPQLFSLICTVCWRFSSLIIEMYVEFFPSMHFGKMKYIPPSPVSSFSTYQHGRPDRGASG